MHIKMKLSLFFIHHNNYTFFITLALTKNLEFFIQKHEGVTSVELEGEEKDKVIVIGDGMDAVNLINCLRKKVGKSDIISLAEAK
ncbi:hypothetical protein TanjilG_27144 [Lupinus angustifolius]|uniref:HMA domain-containing protein n=1 Tax=Lupinus angustifolius TaxID=3871 RepID=A0A4P1QWA3_LUPAN|nr:hypothetical protein TanjilG_27144 [Lupinus angustifolius]